MTVADTPLTWPEPPSMSTLEGLLIFAGIPLLIIVVISLLVMTPSLTKSSQQTPGRSWRGQPEWFGAPRAISASESGEGGSQITTGRGSTIVGAADADETGGASVRW
ncbi:MAG: aa3-type cytochrome oxidase subunit CtaJ [Nocardioidaceae bacterium]